MTDELRDKQHKRIVVLSVSAIVLGLFAIFQIAGDAYDVGRFSVEGFGGQEIYLLCALTLMLCAVVTIVIRSFQDDKAAKYFIRHDTLTGLPNRSNLIHKLSQLRKKKGKKNGALMLINIRRLSSINNSYGRSAGDFVLKTCSERLVYLFQSPNMVSMVAPGTFCIFISEISSSTTIEGLSAEIVKALALPIKNTGQSFYAEPAIGAVLFVEESGSVEDILHRGDLALLEAKSSGLRKPVVFNVGIQSSMAERGALEAELREALEREELETYFQPLMAEDGKTLVGFEALARWQHPRRGMISPACFVPLAQSLNLTEILGRQIMAKACQLIRPLGDLKVSVNVTPDHFLSRDYVAQVRKILNQTGMKPQRLELEITESELISETEGTAKRIEELRDLGVTVALDDFGTGYSGLSYLNKFCVDRIK
ncbi:MAG: EAL domain-containing protein, partial [Salaquimonas sp.]